jgi:hypothetical protein
MDKLIELRDSTQEYCCSCITNVYQEMGNYGQDLQAMRHLFHILSAWSILDQEVTRLTEGE